MAIVNRDLDPTQQRLNFVAAPGLVGVSALIQSFIAPCAGQLLAVSSFASGLSASPTVGIQVQRFVVGVGFTTIPLNGSSLLTITATSTSGIQAHVVPAAGTTLAQLLRGDAVQLVTSTASSAATYMVAAVMQVLQDVKSDFGG